MINKELIIINTWINKYLDWKKRHPHFFAFYLVAFVALLLLSLFNFSVKVGEVIGDIFWK